MTGTEEKKEKIPCSVEILTRNSAATLERCLDSVRDFAEIIVLDGSSTDSTRAIAARYGCIVAAQGERLEPDGAIADFSAVRNRGLRMSAYDWFLYIDSDEYLSAEAVEEMRAIIRDPAPHAHVWWQPRRYVLGRKVVMCAITYPNRQIRFFHKRWVKEFIKPVHERIAVKPGAVIGCLAGLEYVPLAPLPEQQRRWDRYAQLEILMCSGLRRKKILKVFFRQIKMLALYTARFARNLFVCRGVRMPFRYEWARCYDTIKFAGALLRLLLISTHLKNNP